MSDTGPVCSCGTATVKNPCPKHPEVEKERPINRRIELKTQTVLDALKIPWTKFEGVTAIIDQPARVVNLVNLFTQLLMQADDLIEEMRPYLPSHVDTTTADQENLDLVHKDLAEWGNPPKIETVKPSKKPRKR